MQLKHLDVLPVLGDLLRAYAIRLYWTPNYLLAGEQATADALYSAVPDLGGYLLKIGSEKQGVSCQDIAAVWVAFFSRWQRSSLLTGPPGRGDDQPDCAEPDAPRRLRTGLRTTPHSLLRVVMLMRSFAQRNGSVLLRGFIYGSKGVVSSGFNYTKQSRFAIPPSVFVPGDGKYLENVHIMCAPALLLPRLTCARTGTETVSVAARGKYSPLDVK